MQTWESNSPERAAVMREAHLLGNTNSAIVAYYVAEAPCVPLSIRVNYTDGLRPP